MRFFKFIVTVMLCGAEAVALPSRRSINLSRQDGTAPPASTDITPTCGGDDWLLTAANWKSADVDTQFAKWWNNHKASSKSLMRSFSDEFLSQTGGLRCDLDNWCPPPPCTNVNEKGSATPVKWAFFVAQAIVNFNNWMYVQHDAWDIAQEMENSMTVALVQQFTSATDNFPTKKDPLDLVLQVLSIGLSVLAVVEPEAIPVVAALTPVITGARLVDGLVQGSRSTPPDSPTRQLMKVSQVGTWIASYCSDIRSQLNAINVALLAGQQVGGQDLLSLFQGGTFMYWQPGSGEGLRKYYQTLLNAKVINELYMLDRNFIARVPAQGGNCNSDNRYSPDLKYCDLGDNSKVYYYRGYREPERYFSDAYGWDQLPQLGFSIRDVMRSSVEAYKLAGNSYVYQNDTTIVEQILGHKLDSNAGSTPLPPGTFTIPICASEDNSIIGSYNDKDTGYPCTCGGDTKWNKGEKIFKQEMQHPDKMQTRLFWHLTGWDQYGIDKKKGGYSDLWDHCKKDDSFVHMYDDVDKVLFHSMWPGETGTKDDIPGPYVWRTHCKVDGWKDCKGG